jgi:hypothetical protein
LGPDQIVKYGLTAADLQHQQQDLQHQQQQKQKDHEPLKLSYRELRSINGDDDVVKAAARCSEPNDTILTMHVRPKSSRIEHDFAKSAICLGEVLIDLSNLSPVDSFDIVLTVKNSPDHHHLDHHHLDKSYVWLGCTQKHVIMRPRDRHRQVKFKIGFLSNGFYQIGGGQVSNDSVFKRVNLLETNLNLLDNNSLQNLMESTAISVYLKSDKSNRFEFFKCLNSFTISVCK